MLKVNFLEVITPSSDRAQNENKKRLGIKGFILAFVFLAGAFSLSLLISGVVLAQDSGPPAPTVISITQGMKTTREKPLITGLTVNQTTVDVYLDGMFNGRAQVNDDPSGTANFAYYPFLPLKPGKHTLSMVARTNEGLILRSKESTKIEFEVVGFVPPTLLTPVFNLETIESRPFIVGLARNGSQIALYLDGRLEEKFFVKDHPSGTANFAYQPKNDLEVGIHKVQAVAIDSRTGQRSQASGLVIFGVQAPYPAPTLLKPKVSGASLSRPYIIGLAKNGSLVDVYINGEKVATSTPIKNGPSGTGSFAFRPEKDLKSGVNNIFAVAISPAGKMSRASAKVYHSVGEIAKGVVSEGQPLRDEKALVEPEKKAEKPKEPVGEPAAKEPKVIEGEEPEVTLFPVNEEKPAGEVKVESEESKGDVKVTEKESSKKEPEVSEEPGTGPKEFNQEAKDLASGVEAEKEGPNWSRIIGLVILAVLIIVLIIQLLSKEKETGSKPGETLDLFDEGGSRKASQPETGRPLAEKQEKKKANSTDFKSDKKQESKKEDFPSKEDIPPPPPSSNLPF